MIKKSTIEKLGPYLLIFFIFFLWLTYPIVLVYLDNNFFNSQLKKVLDSYGTFGDTFGALNTLFSGLAFGMLVLSLFLQRKELQAQRQELEAQRNEISESNKIAEGQRLITEQQAKMIEQQINDTNVQNFYNTLFKFLEEKQRKISLLKATRSSEIRGEYVFQRFILNFTNRLTERIANVSVFDELNKSEISEDVENAFETAKLFSKGTISNNQIFEYSCFILEYIEKNEDLDISDEAIDIFISYQSLDEIFCMFLYAQKYSKLLDYINKYALLRKVFIFEDEYLAAIMFQLSSDQAFNP